MQPQLQPVDRLTSLPTELFEIICRDAQVDPSCPDLGLVSKAFLHVARQRRFETVRLKSYRQLDELCGMIHLHGYIQSLEIWLQVDYGVPSANRLKRLIRGLTSLRSLDVRGSPRVARELLAPPSATTLPNLTDLSLDQCFESLADFPHPFSPQLYASIGTYAKLCRLSVTVHDAKTSRQLPSARPEYKGKPIPSLGGSRSWAIALHGPLAESPAARDLVASFQTIHALDLCTTSKPDVFASFVGSIQSPQQVQHLGLARAFTSILPDDGVQDLLAHLPNLESVEFGYSIFRQALLPRLATLANLREVAFTADSDMDVRSNGDLGALLDGPNRLAQIRSVRVDMALVGRYDWRNTVKPSMRLAKKHGIRLHGRMYDDARAEVDD